MTNQIIIKTPIQESFNYGSSAILSFEVQNPDKNFYKVEFYLNDVLIYSAEKFLDTITITPSSGLNNIKGICLNKANKKILNTDVEIYFNNINDGIEKQNQLNKLIHFQLPEFIRTEYPKFIDFIKSYYEFLETSNNPNLIPYNLEQYKTADNIPSYILEKLKKQYMPDFDVNLTKDRQTQLTINEANILNNIKQFYDSKGTVDSIKFLFRILYDTEVEIKYPREYVLRPSDGSFLTKTTIKIYLKNFDMLHYLKSAKLYQYDENQIITAHCFVKHQTIIRQNGVYIATAEVENIIGTFDINLPIYLKNIIDGAEIKDFKVKVIPQTDYIINYSVYDVDGSGAIDAGDYGQLLLEFGPVTAQNIENDFDYSGQIDFGDIDFITEYYQEEAVDIDTPIPNSVLKRSVYKIPFKRRSYGYWAKKNSLLSTGNVLPDNIYYHDYSYVVQGKITETKYIDIIRRLGHPAGFSIFGEYSGKSKINFNSNIQSIVPAFKSSLLLGNYAAYTFESHQDLNYIQTNNTATPYRAYPNGYKIGYDGKTEPIPIEYQSYISAIENTSSIPYAELPTAEEDPGGVPDEPDILVPENGSSTDKVFKINVSDIKPKYFFGQYHPDDLVLSTDNTLKPINKYWVVGIHPNRLIPGINTNTSFGDLVIQDVINLGISIGNTNNG